MPRSDRRGGVMTYFGSGVVTPLTCQSIATISGSAIVAPAAAASLPSALVIGPVKGEKLPSAIFAATSLIFVIVSAGISEFQSTTSTTFSATPRKVLAPLKVPARWASTEALKKGDQSVAMQPRYFFGAYFFIDELRLNA